MGLFCRLFGTSLFGDVADFTKGVEVWHGAGYLNCRFSKSSRSVAIHVIIGCRCTVCSSEEFTPYTQKRRKNSTMAKKKAKKSLSQSIRDYLQANPGSTPNQIVAGLAKQGVKVSPGLAANVKYTSGAKAQRKKKAAKKKRARGRKKGAKRMVRRRRPSAQTVNISALQAAAKLLAAAGDAETATAAIKQVQLLQID